tara:strand:- start:272 stop:619 length:348 start_codon:yes stop_codon:yes gene_type:complete
MKYLYLLITLFILVACGPSEEEAASEPTPPPMNVFEGTYAGNVSGDYIIVSILGDALIVSPDGQENINCTLEDPTTTPTIMSCDISLNGSVEIDGDTLTISPEGEQVGVFERIEN